MDPCDWHKIRENLPYILDNLIPSQLLYELYAVDVMTDADMELVKTVPLSRDKNWEILNILRRKPNGYKVFNSCLKKTKQDNIAERLEGSAQHLYTGMVIHDDALQHLQVNDSDFPDDEEFVEEEDKRYNISVEKIHNVYIYPCCQNKGCRRKKIMDNSCPKCGGTDLGLSCVAKLIFCFESNIQLFSVFQDDLRNIIDTNLDLTSKEALMRQLSPKLPFEFSCVIKGDKITNIQVKRPLE